MSQRVLQVAGVVGTAAYAGVMVAIGLGLGGYWATVPPGVWATQFEAVFPFLVPCIAVTLLPGLVGVASQLVAAWRQPDARRPWLVALAAIGVSLLVTVAYHVPANLRIWSGSLEAEALRTELIWWLAFHVVRLGAALVGAVAALGGVASLRAQGLTQPR